MEPIRNSIIALVVIMVIATVYFFTMILTTKKGNLWRGVYLLIFSAVIGVAMFAFLSLYLFMRSAGLN